MASGIYKRTMGRSSPANAAERGSEKATTASSPGAGNGEKQASASQPPMAQRTLYVDRQISRRARSRSKTKKIRRLQILLTLLILGLVFVSMGWILSLAKLQEAEERAVTAETDLRKMEWTIEQAQTDLEIREQEIRKLVKNRIPGLQEIHFNKLLEVNDKYVLNITFSEAGVGDDKSLDYHAVLVNNSDQIVAPNVKVIVFDEFGAQMGMANLAKEQATAVGNLPELEPGESRSYHAQMRMELDATPKYYLLRIK